MTHAILSADVCAYRDLALDTLISVLEAEGPTAAARKLVGEAGGGDPDPVLVRRLRRWRKEARVPRARHSERVLPASGSPSPWWERALAAYGDLVSWRHQQWAQTGYFVTPLFGLFRHGRPPGRVAGSST